MLAAKKKKKPIEHESNAIEGSIHDAAKPGSDGSEQKLGSDFVCQLVDGWQQKKAAAAAVATKYEQST